MYVPLTFNRIINIPRHMTAQQPVFVLLCVCVYVDSRCQNYQQQQTKRETTAIKINKSEPLFSLRVCLDRSTDYRSEHKSNTYKTITKHFKATKKLIKSFVFFSSIIFVAPIQYTIFSLINHIFLIDYSKTEHDYSSMFLRLLHKAVVCNCFLLHFSSSVSFYHRLNLIQSKDKWKWAWQLNFQFR